MQTLLALVLFAAVVPAEAPQDPLGRGYLGVRVQDGGLAVMRVDVGTPADRAGLQAGDEFVSIAGTRPTDFAQVTAQLKAFRPGTVLVIVVRRGGVEKTLTARLMGRPAAADLSAGTFPEP